MKEKKNRLPRGAWQGEFRWDEGGKGDGGEAGRQKVLFQRPQNLSRRTGHGHATVAVWESRRLWFGRSGTRDRQATIWCLR